MARAATPSSFTPTKKWLSSAGPKTTLANSKAFGRCTWMALPAFRRHSARSEESLFNFLRYVRASLLSEWALTHQIQKLVPHPRKWQEPRFSVVHAQRRARKWNSHKRIFVAPGQNGLRNFLSQQRRHCHAVPGVSHRVKHSVYLPSVRHDVERKVQRSAPDVLHFGLAQLRINREHSVAQNLRALSHRIFILREKCCSPTEQHSPVRRQPVVIQIIFRVVDHPVAWA